MTEMADLLARLKKLEDVESIRELQYQYCRHMDEGFRLPDLADLWADDAIWDGGAFGRFEGKAAISDFFERHARVVASSSHYLCNPEIRVEGDKASCRCVGLVPASLIENDAPRDLWIFVTWLNTFTRENGKWLFQSLTASVNRTWPQASVATGHPDDPT